MHVKLVLALSIVGVLAGQLDAAASVDRILVLTRESFHTAATGPYVKISGTFVGSLDPATEPIPNLDKAPRRPDGRIEYASDFIVVAPEGGTAGNRVLLFDVENNGRPVVHGLYNSPLESVVRGLEVGNGFLEDQGFIIAVVSWQHGQGITLPEVPGPDGKPAPLLAVGFTAIRDFAGFLRFEGGDKAGIPNPIAGRVDLAVASGSSQTARFLKSFLYHGFNRTSGRMVFDALHLHVGQVGTMPFIPPAGSDPAVVRATLVGDSAVFPFTYTELLGPLAARGEAAPKILATNVQGDYHRRRLSLVRTGPSGATDTPIPQSVRVWDITGGSHSIILEGNCDMPRANLDWHPLLRAGLVGLVRWARGGESLPPNRLLALEAAEAAPNVSPPPPDQPNATTMLPRQDADGNAVGGPATAGRGGAARDLRGMECSPR